MGITTLIVLALLLVTAVYTIQIYNNLVRLKHAVARAWSNIDVSLKQRHDELPKLVEVCKQYMAYERETLERVVRARAAVAQARRDLDLRALGAAETDLRAGLGQLFALAENYPDLKANEGFRQLSQRISHLEDTIADRRELYNDSVNLHNVRIEQFPDLVVARFMNARPCDLLEFAQERADVDIKTLFG
ncbi:LemA family protein [uncultured Thiodictyon sp.]|uniref:LemA family protein n=1 Tax=uncultured Thiodictyon sp. TaxID=1846217 RepID=UPI0025FB70C9|nr:LemA family protein [uncultured Thiodictyon sp.]